VEATLQGGDRDVNDRQVEDRRDDPHDDDQRELDQRGIERLAAALAGSGGLGGISARRHEHHDRPRENNKQDLRQLAASGQPPGLLAFDGDTAAGWCELAPRSDLGWLAHARHLQPVDDLPVWSIPCFYIRRAYRGRGVTGALIEAAVSAAAAAGAPALEAYPVDTAAPGHTGNLFTGTAAAFASRGFRVVARRRPDRPVMRRDLSVVP
jgi:GNAT superfamily N-acetyltransferase